MPRREYNAVNKLDFYFFGGSVAWILKRQPTDADAVAQGQGFFMISGPWSSLWLMVAHFSSLEKLNLSLSKLGKTGVFYEGFQETAPYCRHQIFDYLERVKLKKKFLMLLYLLKDSKWKIFRTLIYGFGLAEFLSGHLCLG